MKKYFLLLILPFLFISSVNADTIIYDITGEYNQIKLDLSNNSSALDFVYDKIYTWVDEDNPYYIIYIKCLSTDSNMFCTHNQFEVTLMFFNNYTFTTFNISQDYSSMFYIGSYSCLNCSSENHNIFTYNSSGLVSSSYGSSQFNLFTNNGFHLYDSNYNDIYYVGESYSFVYSGYYTDSFILSENDRIPTLKEIQSFNSFSDYESSINYTTVNLDNYEYVLLSLKDYTQTEAFQTNLQVKGQIGITPIYNFGQTSKDSITGVQVQDRCNVSYSDYTTYPFYIIQSDLQNNSIYAIKSCTSGSSFKFDNTIFNITYVTQTNLNDPTITINGNIYHTIPYADLPSTATKNEENNYIPGESGSATDTGGLDSAIKNVQQKMSEIWNTFTYFTDFINQLFSVLPLELRTVLISAFVIAVILGLIKIFIN